MERTLTLFRTYPMLAGLCVFLIIATGLLGTFAIVMSRSGLSTKPIVFVAVFMGIIVVPQLVGHILKARGVIPNLDWVPKAASSARVENEAALAVRDGAFASPNTVLGQGYDPQLLTDIRRIFTSTEPEIAQMAVFRSGEMTVAARFASAEASDAGMRFYARAMGLRLPQPHADGSYTARRAGDWVRFFTVGRTLFAWTGADPAALDRRMAASAGSWTQPVAVETPTDPRVKKFRLLFLAAIPVLLFVAAVWFIKGSTWAASIEPKENRHLPASAAELRSRLLSLQNLPQPISVTAGNRPDELVVTWRAEAQWIDLARARGLRRQHKLVLRLDEGSHRVRVHEYWSSSDWSAGRGGAEAKWFRAKGMTFFQYETQRVYGLQIDPASGRVKPELSYSYTFNLQEMKAPLIDIVTHAGWTWRPVHFDAPAGLKWLAD